MNKRAVVTRLFGRHPGLLILILGLVGVSAIAVYLAKATENLVEAVALEGAELYSQAIEEFRTAYTSEAVEPLRQQGIEVSHDYMEKEHAIPLPATLSMILGLRIGEHEAGAETHLYSAYPFPWREEDNRRIFKDPFSRDAWKFLTANPEKPFYRFEKIGGRRVLRYARADLMRPSCVKCHNTHPDTPRTGWKVGDVRGVLQVDLPLTNSIEASQGAMQSIIILIIMIGGLGLGGTGLFIARIRRNEAKLERAMLTDNAQVMIAYVGRGQRYQFTNKTYRDWFGKTKSEIEGRTVREVVGEDAYKVIGPNMEKALGGQSVSFEARMLSQGGPRDVFATYTPDVGSEGALRGVVVAVTEMTPVKLLERYLDSILLNLPVGVAILEGPEFRYFRINQTLAQLNGLPIEDHLGKSLVEVMPDAAKTLLPILQPILETGKPVLGREFSMRLPGNPDKLRHLIDYLFPIMGTDGKPEAVGAVVVDLTERKDLEEKFLQAQKMEAVGTLAGGIAHDFNNTLLAIMGHVELLADETGSNEDLDGIKKSAQHAAELTRQLLAFSRRQASVPRVIDLSEALFQMEKMSRRVIGTDIELVVLPSDDPCRINIDPGQLEQVLLNLAVNSRDAMSAGGKLTMRVDKVTRDGAEQAVVSVIDTGVGMSDEEQSKMFEPFFTTKDRGKGTGLGLSVCYGIVQQSGGHIEVESAPGEGTIIRMYFPLVEEEVQTTPQARPEEKPPTGTERILLVEDEPAVRRLGARALRKSGYTILEAGNGEEALAVLKDKGGSIDAMITDLVMPRMGGRELIERMYDDYPNVTILCTSGYAEPADLRAGEVATLPFLQKPYQPIVLLRKIREVLDGRGTIMKQIPVVDDQEG